MKLIKRNISRTLAQESYEYKKTDPIKTTKTGNKNLVEQPRSSYEPPTFVLVQAHSFYPSQIHPPIYCRDTGNRNDVWLCILE